MDLKVSDGAKKQMFIRGKTADSQLLAHSQHEMMLIIRFTSILWIYLKKWKIKQKIYFKVHLKTVTVGYSVILK